MTIQKPYNINIATRVLDGNAPNLVSWKNSGDVSASFAINIYNNDTGILIWSLPRTYSFALSYTIPANSIPNGAEYKLEVTVWNASDQSATSQLVVFQAYSTPIVTTPEIGTVGNHTYLFSAEYSQAENDPISNYTINLYDSSQTLLKTSGVKTDGLLEQRFDLMKNGEQYFIEFIVTSKKGLTTSSGLIPFTVVYENPSMYFELSADTVPEKASVKLKWKVRQVIGKTSVSPLFLNDTEIDLTNGKVFYDEGFEIVDDFTLKIWFRNIQPNTDLINLKGSNGTIRLQYKNSDNRFHLYKQTNGWNYHYTYSLDLFDEGVFISPYQYVEDESNNKYYVFLCLQQKNSIMDIVAEKTPIETISMSGVAFDQLSGVMFSELYNAKFS